MQCTWKREGKFSTGDMLVLFNQRSNANTDLLIRQGPYFKDFCINLNTYIFIVLLFHPEQYWSKQDILLLNKRSILPYKHILCIYNVQWSSIGTGAIKIKLHLIPIWHLLFKISPLLNTHFIQNSFHWWMHSWNFLRIVSICLVAFSLISSMSSNLVSFRNWFFERWKRHKEQDLGNMMVIRPGECCA